MNLLWNSHLNCFGSAFPAMLSGNKFVDVTLACEGRRIHCHRVVLAACSPYFSDLLEENPERHPIVILPKDVKFCTLQDLVNFMYKGEVSVKEDDLEEFVKCGEMFQVHGISRNSSAHPPDHHNSEEQCPETESEEFTMGFVVDDTVIKAESMIDDPQPATIGIFSVPVYENSSIECPETLNKVNELLSECQDPKDSKKRVKRFNKLPGKSAKRRNKMVSRNSYGSPPKNFVLKKNTNGKSTGFSRENLWSALMAVKDGMSIGESVKNYNVNYSTLRRYMKRHGIESSFRQGGFLKKIAERQLSRQVRKKM
ncbi:hypothetical protein DMENIID0001_149160 [Sergentomyia squamirostris]